MGPEAEKILNAACDPDGGGEILFIPRPPYGGSGREAIQVGKDKRHMIPSDADHHAVRTWVDGLRELVALDYIRDRGRGTVFDVTDTGREAWAKMTP